MVPGGGPSLDGESWITSRHSTQRNRRKPYLVDNTLLGQRFREKFAAGFRRLVRAGKLRLDGEWSKLQDPKELKAWLDKVTEPVWNVFIEGPPKGKSNPDQLLKYLAGYMSGGPISNGRILGDEHGHVVFWARSKNKAQGNLSRPFSLSGREFVRRWSLHILPKGYTRSRCYGGYHGSKRKDYLNRCRELLGTQDSSPIEGPEPMEREEPSLPVCPRCNIEMDCIEQQRRPSWKEVFERRIYADPGIYSPLHHIRNTGFPAFAHEPYG